MLKFGMHPQKVFPSSRYSQDEELQKLSRCKYNNGLPHASKWAMLRAVSMEKLFWRFKIIRSLVSQEL